ncbi:2-oxo-4-hydroxy-4-carboxy-5-ureidoimidazoline decarboxylase [Nocardioides acrostichi]|uniref:2-oxo-4-hydroxy-4-carboxy-5-ureidoimidazoline decarboxylase n=1 Tax=Nocardioides acrostichi TaxID=2784339 RepID=A0A930UUR9_9ACTN|nr:2-oxo-4-hydroxy-4-carboxy-5-ureidoimidazoline decarboxylase [Nocardioides acrostichi]MBF4161233.1 2-oxo-4-hydroxy-4-carboxy-5-ureidoimidazoline decarboxylase [Nocardioides acrostichi]
MDLQDFNALGVAEAATAVRPCVDIDRFVDAVVTGRPYADLETLLATARAHAATWTPAEVSAALADHPRIGERPAGDDASAALSRSEQGGVTGLSDDELQARIAAGNRAYEERFDRIFLIRAAGRSATEILHQLEQRLANDPDHELAVTAGELAEIAVLRLRGLVTEGVGAR